MRRSVLGLIDAVLFMFFVDKSTSSAVSLAPFIIWQCEWISFRFLLVGIKSESINRSTLISRTRYDVMYSIEYWIWLNSITCFRCMTIPEIIEIFFASVFLLMFPRSATQFFTKVPVCILIHWLMMIHFPVSFRDRTKVKHGHHDWNGSESCICGKYVNLCILPLPPKINTVNICSRYYLRIILGENQD